MTAAIISGSSVSAKVGAVVWATGWKPYDAARIQPYGYDRFANVITSVEFERMLDAFGPTGGKLVRPSDGKEVKNVAFIPFTTDAGGVPYGFELLNTGAQRFLRAGEDRSAMMAQQYLGLGSGAAEGFALVAADGAGIDAVQRVLSV